MYLSLSLSMDLVAALVTATTGLAVAPHFDNPYRSTSGELSSTAAVSPQGTAPPLHP